MKIAKHAIQIAVEVLNRTEIGPGERKLDVRIVDQIFSQLAVVLSQPQGPRIQATIPREEHFLVRIDITSNY